MILKHTGYYRNGDITITFGPGTIRYLNPLELTMDEGNRACDEIAAFGVEPIIEFPFPDVELYPFDMGIKDSSSLSTFKYQHFPTLFEKRIFQKIVGDIAAIFHEYFKHPFPSEAYHIFFDYVQPDELELGQFLASWVREASSNIDLANSYRSSEEHVVLKPKWTSHVFRKTEYLKKRRSLLEVQVILKSECLKHEGGGYDRADLTLIFGPGIIRYLDPLSLISDAGQRATAEIASFEFPPVISFPDREFGPASIGIKDCPSPACWRAEFRYREFPSLFEDRGYREIIQDLAVIFTNYLNEPFSSDAYLAFYDITQPDVLAMDKFFESWDREASDNRELACSYIVSNNHIVVNMGSKYYVFKKTEFLNERRLSLEQKQHALEEVQRILEIEERELASDKAQKYFDETIRLSSFETFTYLMEDSRNGSIKIGKSRNPERREKTLQSEAPSVELRFAIPASHDMEASLHEEYASFRRRGEWFELSVFQLRIVIEKLMLAGDTSRVITSHEWIGMIFLASYSGSNESQHIKQATNKRC